MKSHSPRTEEPCDARETGSVVPLRREVVKYGQCLPAGPRQSHSQRSRPGTSSSCSIVHHSRAGTSRATAECWDMSKQSEIHHVSAGVTLLMDSWLLQSVKERALFAFSAWDLHQAERTQCLIQMPKHIHAPTLSAVGCMIPRTETLTEKRN